MPVYPVAARNASTSCASPGCWCRDRVPRYPSDLTGDQWAVLEPRAHLEEHVMSICSRPGAEVPALTARMARASNPAGTAAMWVRDRLDGLWRDEDFAGWYPRDGRPGISPAQLATVSVLQFLLDLSDRDAAEAVRCRIDFKYALGLELDDPGFHHSVLGRLPGPAGGGGPGGPAP